MKSLLVTGASSDVGMGLMRKISNNYENIYCHYCHSENRIIELREEIGNKIIPIQADFSVEGEAEKLCGEIKKCGVIPNHIVHLSAPKAYNQNFHKCSWENFEDGVNTGLRSIVIILEHMIPILRRERYGKIVFMLTSYVLGVPPKFQAPYIASKYALLGLMRSLSAEYADRGITVNAVSPDMIETRFIKDINDKIIWNNANNSPLGRNLTTVDVIPAFEYLLSDQADAVNGQNLGITGGVEWAR